ncbi:VWA domain-containing protein [Allokutzneria albata]|uniref:VWA domain containing CoxE-like protein n=1 Tax=Allokutzneria albata TaxID=211114 RepID=A0A1G9YB38_ALLAB|nr:VWA domain-containing protein [Allokutzneria albata]SDN05745.1 VWA domain containing CoxE-like protein [Allokutzneria albata]
MTAHMIADPTATGSAVFPAAPGWDALSAALTAEVPVIADRDDLLVTIAPGAGHGAPACFLPAMAMIEIDGTHLHPVDPATATPHRISDRTRYAPMWGALTHECAHSKHTRWVPPPPDADPGAVEAALLLEEPRIERAQIRRRPDDRHWLRACVKTIVTDGLNLNDPALAPAMTPRDAARTAALFLARTDGGILTRAETAPVALAVEAVLGAETLGKLPALWRKAFRVADDDTDAMLDLGRQWCEIIGPDPDTVPPHLEDPTAASDPSATPTPSPLADAIGKTLRKVARAVARAKLPDDPAEVTARAKAAAEAAAKNAADTARTVFSTPSGSRKGPTATTGTRPPTTSERTAARVLGRALTTAGARERVATKTTSPIPPGRLRMRGALARQAQLASGAMPTAEPFTRTTRAAVPIPPLRLGIACDVSGSMNAFAEPVASTAWILATAAAQTPVPADTATVIFGHHVRPITHPGTAPATVTDFATRDNWEAVDTAIDALDGALDLSRPGAARLLVIVSDGDFRPEPRQRGQQLLDRLRANGCAVLWITPDVPWRNPLTGTTVHVMTDPTTTAQAIGRAATAALRATR